MERFWQAIVWAVGLAWVYKAATVWAGLGHVPDLLVDDKQDAVRADLPSLAVVVPARDEANTLRPALRSLLVQDYPRLQVIAVDDRSSDGTPLVLRELAAEYPARLRVITITELPSGWLGKTHAMVCGAEASTSEYLLFTDADVHFGRDALRRAMSCTMRGRADHFVLLPTTIIHRWDEAAVLSFFQLLGAWAVRLWRVADPRSPDALGVGAFNLVRRSAYDAVGGFAALRMEIVEDIGLARRMKAAGYRSGAAVGKGLVSLHWAAGLSGIVGVMTKNLFSAVRFHVPLALVLCGWLIAFGVMPFVALTRPATVLPGTLTLLALLALHWRLGRYSGLGVWNALLTPLAALTFCYALLRSTLVTLRQGGVRWRGTFYPLQELRRHAAPLPRFGRLQRPRNLPRP